MIQRPPDFSELRRNVQQGATTARFMGAIMGLVFGGIGLTTLVFLWGSPFGQWDSPPIFFRIFGSFIAIAFVAVGGLAAITALKGGATPGGSLLSQSLAEPGIRPAAGATDEASIASYTCPHCGAPLPAKADVSPLGDVKCPFCNVWFNIHQKTA
jgi:hypothetical protein